MKTSSLLYIAATVIVVIAAMLQITHIINKNVFHILFIVSMALGIGGNQLKRREAKKS